MTLHPIQTKPAGGLTLLACLLVLASLATLPARAAGDITEIINNVSDIGEGDQAVAEQAAAAQAAGNGDSLGYHSTEVETQTFSGTWTPPERPADKPGLYMLAIFSDDGCKVSVDGTVHIDNFNKGQPLPDLGKSFHVLDPVLIPGEPVDVTVEYSNCRYIQDGEEPDIDGCTLFVFFQPVEVKQDDELWYFFGYDSVNYEEKINLTVEPSLGSGSYTWKVISPQGFAALRQKGQYEITIQGNNVELLSEHPSFDPDDIVIEITYKEGIKLVKLEHRLTVFAPFIARVVDGPIDTNYGGEGFQTKYTMQIEDQFGEKMEKQVGVNESFPNGFTNDYSLLNTWAFAGPSGGATKPNAPSEFDDFYSADTEGKPFAVPQTVHPGEPGAGEKVKHGRQEYKVGSVNPGEGGLMKDHVLQLYRGRGRQE